MGGWVVVGNEELVLSGKQKEEKRGGRRKGGKKREKEKKKGWVSWKRGWEKQFLRKRWVVSVFFGCFLFFVRKIKIFCFLLFVFFNKLFLLKIFEGLLRAPEIHEQKVHHKICASNVITIFKGKESLCAAYYLIYRCTQPKIGIIGIEKILF